MGWRFRPPRCRGERGAVAVEAAIVLPVLVLVVTAPTIALAHFCLQWDATYKAVQDAALAVATAPRIELTTAAPDGSFAAISIAKAIMTKELAATAPALVPQAVGFVCEFQVRASLQMKSCRADYVRLYNHRLVRVHVSISIPYINPITGSDTYYSLQPYAAASYVGS